MKAQQNTESIRIVVQPAFKEMVQKQASNLGVNMTTYIKHLILSDIQNIPVRTASKRVVENIEKSIRDRGIETKGRMASTVMNKL